MELGEGAGQGERRSTGIKLRAEGWEKAGRKGGEEDAARKGLQREEEGGGARKVKPQNSVTFF